MKAIKRVTSNCIINDRGEVVFYRNGRHSKKEVVLNTIEDAISQNFHILENLFVDIVDIYDKSLIKTGEISTVREIIFEIEDGIDQMAAGLKPEDVDLSYLVKDLKRSKNKHKKNIAKILASESSSLTDLAKAHSSAVKRVNQLQAIINGTIVQTKKLTEIRNDCHQKIIYAHDILAESELDLIRLESTPKELHDKVVSKIVKDIAGEGANKVVFALNSITKVNPYKKRVESKEVKRLAELNNLWVNKEINQEDVLTIISSARSKLKRVVRRVDNFKMKKEWR